MSVQQEYMAIVGVKLTDMNYSKLPSKKENVFNRKTGAPEIEETPRNGFTLNGIEVDFDEWGEDEWFEENLKLPLIHVNVDGWADGWDPDNWYVGVKIPQGATIAQITNSAKEFKKAISDQFSLDIEGLVFSLEVIS